MWFLFSIGGHYTAYAQNWLNSKWYEFDDTAVTEVDDMTVMHAEAYVLFYKWVCHITVTFVAISQVKSN